MDCRRPPRPDDPSERLQCPRSGTDGSAVTLETVKALLTERALRRISGAAYRFCGDADCDVVYYDGGAAFTIEDIRVPVWQKQPFGARMVCYCFGENEGDMRREPWPSQAVERVRGHIRAGRCACAVRNPRGTCCLGDVIAAVKRVEASRHDVPDR